MTLRNMRQSDLPHVNLLLSKSFTHARIQRSQKDSRVPLCRESFLKMYLAANPSASFVIEKNGKIFAYCFSRLWGQVAWLGPVSVLPAEEDKGHGKKIVLAVTEVLKSQGARTIGLEMSAYSSRNLAFYTKLGFLPGQPVVDVIRKTPDEEPSHKTSLQLVRLARLPDSERAELLTKVKEFSENIEPGLDYTKEIQLASEFGFGEGVAILDSSQIAGFILAHTEPYSQEEERRFLKINILQAASGLFQSGLRSILYLVEAWAREVNLKGIYIRVPTRYVETFKLFLENGFTVVNIDIRLTLKGYGQRDKPERVNISKWE